MCSPLCLLDPVPFHDLSVSVDTDVPSPTRLGLSVQDGWISDVVVLKHALLKLALRREVFLKDTQTQGEEHTHTHMRTGQRRTITNLECLSFFICSIIYIFILQFDELSWEWEEMGPTFHCDRVTGASVAASTNCTHTHTNSFQHAHLPHGQSGSWVWMP